jgi:hypothetical protein
MAEIVVHKTIIESNRIDCVSLGQQNETTDLKPPLPISSIDIPCLFYVKYAKSMTFSFFPWT